MELFLDFYNDTGKSLILESVNPQNDERLFIEFQEKYKLTTWCVQKLFFVLTVWDFDEKRLHWASVVHGTVALKIIKFAFSESIFCQVQFSFSFESYLRESAF